MRQVSDDCIASLIDSEDVSLTVYKDQAGLPTIGVGHLLTKYEIFTGAISIGGEYVKYDEGITADQAIILLRQDLAFVGNAVDDLVTVIINQHEFDALVHFTFNVGVSAFKHSTLLRKLNNAQFDDVPDEIMRWVHITKGGNKVVSSGLLNRRRKEAAMFKEGKYA